MTNPRLTRRDRLAAWVVTGPVGRMVAFALDLGTAWWRWLRGDARARG
jgi:hypothetical protein